MSQNVIRVVGARAHNLKNITVEIPRDKFVVITGLSGSGKSSLAFDTIFAEGQRRYVESLSAYARQFLGQMEKPDVDSIEGLSPAVSIDQKATSHNPRSTVGTVTEIYDYLRLLFARVGIPHCPICGREVVRQSAQEIVDNIEVELYRLGKTEVPSSVIGDMVIERLQELDHIAYIRFASVYREFTDIAALKQAVDTLVDTEAQTPPAGQLPLLSQEELTVLGRRQRSRK